VRRDPFAVLRVESDTEIPSLGAGVRVLLRVEEREGLLLLVGPENASPSTSGGFLRLVAECLSAERRTRGASGWIQAIARAEGFDEIPDPHE
jgi:hypothetical protein